MSEEERRVYDADTHDCPWRAQVDTLRAAYRVASDQAAAYLDENRALRAELARVTEMGRETHGVLKDEVEHWRERALVAEERLTAVTEMVRAFVSGIATCDLCSRPHTHENEDGYPRCDGHGRDECHNAIDEAPLIRWLESREKSG